MDNFTLAELQEMVDELNTGTTLVSAVYVHTNASNEGVYDGTDTDGDNGHIYVTDRGSEGFSININSLITAADVVNEYPTYGHNEEGEMVVTGASGKNQLAEDDPENN